MARVHRTVNYNDTCRYLTQTRTLWVLGLLPGTRGIRRHKAVKVSFVQVVWSQEAPCMLIILQTWIRGDSSCDGVKINKLSSHYVEHGCAGTQLVRKIPPLALVASPSSSDRFRDLLWSGQSLGSSTTSTNNQGSTHSTDWPQDTTPENQVVLTSSQGNYEEYHYYALINHL